MKGAQYLGSARSLNIGAVGAVDHGQDGFTQRLGTRQHRIGGEGGEGAGHQRHGGVAFDFPVRHDQGARAGAGTNALD